MLRILRCLCWWWLVLPRPGHLQLEDTRDQRILPFSAPLSLDSLDSLAKRNTGLPKHEFLIDAQHMHTYTKETETVRVCVSAATRGVRPQTRTQP